MKRKPLTTYRQKRELVAQAPTRKGNIKITRDGWIDCARVCLIEEGIGGVRVDRLARRLDVTRGGFYYHFKDHQQILDELLATWGAQNRFTPARVDVSTPAASAQALNEIVGNLVHESGFDPQFDMAVREWARISQPVADFVHEVDQDRTDVLEKVFIGIGYTKAEAVIRARVFYWHQIGYYVTGFQEKLEDREANVRIYMGVLAGEKYEAALKEALAA